MARRGALHTSGPAVPPSCPHAMPRSAGVWVSLGVLCRLLLAAGAVECSEEETPLRPMPAGVSPPTGCLMACTGLTYDRKQRLGDDDNIRLRDATEGGAGEHCWSTELKCTVGESFRSAYVVLPVDVAAVGHGQVDVRAAAAAAADPPSAAAGAALRPHAGATAIDDGCGLRYDVTQHFGSRAAGTSFCVRVAGRGGDPPGDPPLRCPPFLVTFWMRKQSNRQDGG